MASDVIVLIYLFVMLRLDRIDVNYCGIVDHNFVLLGKVFLRLFIYRTYAQTCRL